MTKIDLKKTHVYVPDSRGHLRWHYFTLADLHVQMTEEKLKAKASYEGLICVMMERAVATLLKKKGADKK